MSELMRAAAITDNRKVEVKSVKRPAPGRGEVLVRIKACALCTWEQRVFSGISKMPLPFVGGHEMAGVIEAVGEGVDENEYRIGGKVAARTLNACGECYYCRQGKENLCVTIGKPNRFENKEFSGPGGLGEYLVASARDIYFFPDDIPYAHAAFAEPLACAVNSIEKGRIEFGNDVVIIGAGIMGLLHVMLSKRKGARVIVSEVDGNRRKVAEELGADIAFNPIETDPVKTVKDLTEGRGADAVFNTTAIARVAEQAVSMAGKLGRVVMYSSIHPDNPVSVSPNWIHNTEVEIKGAVSPPIDCFQKSVRLLASKIIVPERLISGCYPLGEAQMAFEEAIKPDSYRIIVINE